MENIVTNIDNDNVAEEYNAELKSASEADTLPMDAKVAGSTEKSKSTQVRVFKISCLFTLCIELL